MTGVRVPADRGEPPPGWSWKPLSSLARLEAGHTPSRRVPEWWGGDVPWLALPDIRELDGRTATGTLETTNALGLANSSARLLPVGTVCLSRTASIGFVTVLGVPMATSQDFVNWICMPELDPWFLANALLASRDYLRNPASGAIHKTIYMPEVESFELCVPQTVTEQRRIVAALNQQIVVLRLAQAKAFAIDEDTKLLSAGLRESALLIGAETKLDEVAHIAGQLVDPTLSQYRILPHINGENIEQATGRLGSYKSAAEDKVFSQRFKFEKGDVLYSKLRPYLRKATLAPEEGLCSADIYPLKVFKDKILPEFLLLELLSDRFTRYAIKESARSRMPKLNRDALFKWKLFVPSLGEQQSIVDTIRESAAAIESLRHRARAQTAELDLMEPALLRAAFSGAL
jgi:type I restriction enzyme S subunit